MTYPFAHKRSRHAAADLQPPPVVRLLTVEQAGCDDIVRAWDDLASDASEPNAFNESWYLLPALTSFGGDTVMIFTLWDHDLPGARMIGLMPISIERLYGRWPLPHSQNWLHPNAFLGTPLVRGGCEHVYWCALLSHFDNKPGQSKFLHISGLTISGLMQQALDDICKSKNRKYGLVYYEERAFLQSDLTPTAYYENAVRAKKRKELRRQKNRLSEMGELQFTRSRANENLAEWIDEFLTLERRGWKGQNSSALDCADGTRNLFRNALHGAVAAGKLERLDIRLDGKPLAMLVNFICSPGSFSFKTAFDEDFARFSPGVLLQIENLDLLECDAINWCDSCAAEGHPMIDSLWTGRRAIGRYSIAIGGHARRAFFGLLLHAEQARMERKRPQ